MNKKEKEMIKNSLKKEHEYLDIDYIKGTYVEAVLKATIDAGEKLLKNNPDDSESQ